MVGIDPDKIKMALELFNPVLSVGATIWRLMRRGTKPKKRRRKSSPKSNAKANRKSPLKITKPTPGTTMVVKMNKDEFHFEVKHAPEQN